MILLSEDPVWQWDPLGWLIAAPIEITWQQIPSLNCDDRPPNLSIELLVLHNISLPPGEFGGDAVPSFFTNQLDGGAHPFFTTIQHLRVSAHFFLRRDGALIQFVPCRRRAWHAGVSHWQGRERCNDFSIGIELEGTDTTAYTEAQYQVLTTLAEALMREYPLRAVAGHSDIAPTRKTDPGEAFDWSRFTVLPRYTAVTPNDLQQA